VNEKTLNVFLYDPDKANLNDDDVPHEADPSNGISYHDINLGDDVDAFFQHDVNLGDDVDEFFHQIDLGHDPDKFNGVASALL